MSLLEALIVVVLLMWLLGIAFVPATGSLIHVLLVIVLVLVIVRIVQGRSL